jgi:hypothetical protein
VQAVIEVPVKEEEAEQEGGEAHLEAGAGLGGVSQPDPASATYALTLTATGTATGGTGAGGGGRGNARRRRSSASSHQRRSFVVAPSDDDGSYVDGGEESLSDASEGGEYVDEEEVENAIANGGGTPATTAGRRKTVPWGKKHIRHEPDEEDDELMMYAKVRLPRSFFHRPFTLHPSLLASLTPSDSQDNPHNVRPLHENLHPRRLPRVTDATAQRLSATNASAQKRRTTETGSAGLARAKRRR